MITKKTVYVTSFDDKQHDTLKKAKEHSLNKAREIIAKRLDTLLPKEYINNRDVYRIVMALTETYDKALEFVVELNKCIDKGSSRIDEDDED